MIKCFLFIYHIPFPSCLYPDLFRCRTFTYVGGFVRCSSAMMKDDICDKSTDQKLSNHSRKRLLAAPLRSVPSPHVYVALPPNATAAQWMAAGVGRTQSAFILMVINVSHVVAKGVSSQHCPPLNISSPLSLSSAVQQPPMLSMCSNTRQ